MGWCGVWLGGVRQLATTLLSSFSNSNYFIDSCNITCNYVVHSCEFLWHNLLRCYLLDQVPTTLLAFISRNLKLRCYLLDQVPTTLLTLITQLATTLSTLVAQLATTFVVTLWFRRELGILHEYVSHHRGKFMRKEYRGREKLVCHWCSMVCIKELHSQKFVLPKPRFTIVRKIPAMEVHKPQCQLAAEDDWSTETHLLTKNVMF